MIKTILFDYAGVLTPTVDNFVFAEKYHKRFKMTPKKLMKKSYKNWDMAVIGKLPKGKFWKDIGEELSIDPDELRDLVIRTFPIDNELINFIDKTKDHYTIAMVSNQIEDWLEKVIDDNNLKNKFHYFINSYTVGARKPDPKIFLEALRQTKSKPEETLFIDDSLENIEAAKKLGMQTIWWNKENGKEDPLKEFIKLINL